MLLRKDQMLGHPRLLTNAHLSTFFTDETIEFVLTWPWSPVSFLLEIPSLSSEAKRRWTLPMAHLVGPFNVMAERWGLRLRYQGARRLCDKIIVAMQVISVFETHLLADVGTSAPVLTRNWITVAARARTFSVERWMWLLSHRVGYLGERTLDLILIGRREVSLAVFDWRLLLHAIRRTFTDSKL